MTHPDDPAFPVLLNPKDVHSLTGGLTKREYFAALILNALISMGNLKTDVSDDQLVLAACLLADKFIAELSKEKP